MVRKKQNTNTTKKKQKGNKRIWQRKIKANKKYNEQSANSDNDNENKNKNDKDNYDDDYDNDDNDVYHFIRLVYC